MMAAPLLRMSPEHFLAWERTETERHQYVRGEVFAMAGGSPRHNAIVANAIIALGATLRGRGCTVLSSDQRIRSGDGEQYVYVDVSVVCGPLRLVSGTTDVLENPDLVVEVLSPGTEAYDRGDKWEGYQRIPELRDYVLVSQGSVRVEHFARQAGGTWRYGVSGPGAVVLLSDGTELSVDALYDGVMQLSAG
jgi:Uma2 family endonuclease